MPDNDQRLGDQQTYEGGAQPADSSGVHCSNVRLHSSLGYRSPTSESVLLTSQSYQIIT